MLQKRNEYVLFKFDFEAAIRDSNDDDVIVLNVDGSSMGNLGPAGFWALLRRGDGQWLVGCYGSIGVADNVLAELAAMMLVRANTLAWDFGARKLVCYADSTTYGAGPCSSAGGL